MPRPRKRADDNICPICGQFMNVRCVGHRESPFVDGKTYDSICFLCFSIPKTFVITKAEDGADVWNGPFFDKNHLFTPEEMVQEGIADDIKTAKISYKALVKSIKKSKRRSK